MEHVLGLIKSIFPVVSFLFEFVILGTVLFHIWHMTKSNKEIDRSFSVLKRQMLELQLCFEDTDKRFDILFEHFKAITQKVEELERQELLQALVITAQQARISLIHYTYTFRTPSEEKEMGPLLEAIQDSHVPKKDIRLLGPDMHTNLDRLYSRKKTGAHLRVSSDIKNSDLRFQVADCRQVVVTIGGASEESRRGFVIDSVYLATILTEWFDKEWDDAVDYDDFIIGRVFEAAHIDKIRKLPKPDLIKYIAKRLGLDETEVERVLKVIESKKIAFEPV